MRGFARYNSQEIWAEECAHPRVCPMPKGSEGIISLMPDDVLLDYGVALEVDIERASQPDIPRGHEMLFMRRLALVNKEISTRT